MQGTAGIGRSALHPSQAWETSDDGMLTENSIQALQIGTMVNRGLPQVPTVDSKAMQLQGWAKLEYLRSQIMDLIPANQVRVRDNLWLEFKNEDIELGRLTVSDAIEKASGRRKVTQVPYSQWPPKAKEALENFDFSEWVNL